jgi:hypothetical protein
MEIRLDKWKRFVWACLGASVLILTAAAADVILVPRQRVWTGQYVSWFIVWILLQSAGIAPAIRLTLGAEWRRVPLFLRFPTIFQYLAVSWIALFSFGLRLERVIDTPPEDIIILLILVGLTLAGIYLRLRNRLVTSPESTFP